MARRRSGEGEGGEGAGKGKMRKLSKKESSKLRGFKRSSRTKIR